MRRVNLRSMRLETPSVNGYTGTMRAVLSNSLSSNSNSGEEKVKPPVVFGDFTADDDLRAVLDLIADVRIEPRALNRA